MARRSRGMKVSYYLIALTALCVAVGYIDALASFYVRGMYQVTVEGGEFAQAVVQEMPPRIVSLELTRQAAFIVALLAAGVIAGRNNMQQVGTFTYSLGGWIIFRYVSIRTLTDWPASLSDLDAVLFLPEPVYAPVWMALIIAGALTTSGVLLIRAGAVAMRRSK